MAKTDLFIFTDMEGAQIRTNDPIGLVSEIWVKGWEVPSIGLCDIMFSTLEQGEAILLEESRVLVRKCYRIV